MALLHWRDAFNTGIPSADYEHRRLFELINELHDTLNSGDAAGTEAFMGALHDKIAAHFALEERLMRDVGYDGYIEHKADHERLLDDIREMMEEQRAGRYQQAPDRLAGRLERWFSVHFNTLDARLHRIVGDVGLRD